MTLYISIGVVVAVVVAAVFAMCRTSKQAGYVLCDVSTPEALRQLLAKAQREVDALNGVRR